MGKGTKIVLSCVGLVILGVICFIVISAMGLGAVSKVANDIDNQTKASEEKEKTAFDNPEKISTPIIVKDVQWTVVEAKDLGSNLKSKYGAYGTDCNANSGKFIQVKLKIKNNGKEIATLTNLDLYDSEKNEYKTSTDVYGCIEGDLYILDNINPGIEKTFVAIYEVPTTAQGLKVKVGDLSFFTNDHRYVSLGL